VTKESGHSMEPRIKHQQPHKLAPITWEQAEVDDIVYCKVHGNFYTHLVLAKGSRGVLIGNNKGRKNGWTKQVYGKVVEIYAL